jgi:uncharacterized protein (DUF1697 family)
MGLAGVRTYIQSGNAVFDSALPPEVLETMIRDGVAARFGFAPETFVRIAGEIAEALADHPFAEADPARVHVFFLRETPRRMRWLCALSPCRGTAGRSGRAGSR